MLYRATQAFYLKENGRVISAKTNDPLNLPDSIAVPLLKYGWIRRLRDWEVSEATIEICVREKMKQEKERIKCIKKAQYASVSAARKKERREWTRLKICSFCGRSFKAARKDVKFCNNIHRQAAYRVRIKGQAGNRNGIKRRGFTSKEIKWIIAAYKKHFLS